MTLSSTNGDAGRHRRRGGRFVLWVRNSPNFRYRATRALINSKCTTYGNMRTQQKQEAIGPAHPIRAFQAGLRFA